MSGSIASNGSDRLTFSNTGTKSIPAGTTITWVVQNLSGASQTYTVAGVSGVTLTSGNGTSPVANNATITYTFTLSAALAVNATVEWSLATAAGSSASYKFNSKVNTPGCAAAGKCIADNGNDTFGTACPSGLLAPTALAPDTSPPRPGSVVRRS